MSLLKSEGGVRLDYYSVSRALESLRHSFTISREKIFTNLPFADHAMLTFQCEVQDSSNHSPNGRLPSFINNNVLVTMLSFISCHHQNSHMGHEKLIPLLVL